MNEPEPVSPFSIGGNRYGEVCEHGCLVRTCELCDYGEMMPDTDRVPTEADRRMAGTLSTIWPMSMRHPEDSIHLAIYVNDILCDEDADREFIGISIAKAETRAMRETAYRLADEKVALLEAGREVEQIMLINAAGRIAWLEHCVDDWKAEVAAKDAEIELLRENATTAARIEELEAERDDAKAGEDSWVAHYDRVAGYWEEAKAEIERLRAGADWAWTIIAKKPGFEAVAERWLDEFYYPMLRWPDG